MENLPDDLREWSRALYQALESNDGSRSFVECLDAAAARQSRAFRDTLNGVRSVVALGFPLSRAMSLFPVVFDTDFVTIVRYGELYGELDVVLRRYAERPEDTAPRCHRPAAP